MAGLMGPGDGKTGKGICRAVRTGGCGKWEMHWAA